MSFDADAYIEALEPPRFTIKGKTHVGQFISIEDWGPFEQRLAKFQRFSEALKSGKVSSEDQISYEDIKRLILDYCNHAFPSPWYQLFNPWHRTVGSLVIRLPAAAMYKAARDFFECQARSMDVDAAVQEDES